MGMLVKNLIAVEVQQIKNMKCEKLAILKIDNNCGENKIFKKFSTNFDRIPKLILS